jgi:two-component system sensor histidine kinase HupT/HoxJ
VAIDLPESIPVKGSPGQLQQVLINLVQNAADATAGNAAPRLEVSARIDHGEVEIRLRDNGPGIAPEALGKIFDPFFTTKPIGKGTGLGLSISYGIVERHGGELRADNAPGGGALFLLRLPLAG